MSDLYQRLDDARETGVLAVLCPVCAGQAGFHAPFVYLTGEDAESALDDPGVLGVAYSGGFMAELFADVFLFSDEERAEVRGRSDGSYGVLVCPSCGNRSKHRLAWPKDAWFQVDVDGDLIWAFNREHAEDTIEFLQSLDVIPRLLLPMIREEIELKVPASMMKKKLRKQAIAALEAKL